MKIHWIRFRVNYFLPVRALLTLGRTVPFWSGNPFWLSDVRQPVTLVCVKQWAYSSSQRLLAHGGDKRHFFLIWKEITGPETALAAKQKLRPRAILNQGHKPVFVCFFFFFFCFFPLVTLKGCVVVFRYCGVILLVFFFFFLLFQAGRVFAATGQSFPLDTTKTVAVTLIGE